MKDARRIGSGVAIVVVAGIAIAHALRQSEEVVVTTSTIDVGSLAQRVVATGTLQVVTSVDVGTQVSGTVESLGADFNGLVRAGQVVARLDPSTYEAQLAQARATLAQDVAQVDNARVAVNDAQNQLARARELFSEQLMTQADFDAAGIAAESAAASLKSAQAQEEQARAVMHGAEVDLTHTIIRAPIDGIVVARDVDAGQTVAASVQTPTMFTIASDLTKMQLQASIDESDVGELNVGDTATFTVDAYPHDTFSGTVSMVRQGPTLQAPASTGTAATTGTTGGSGGVGGPQPPTTSTQTAPGSLVSYTTIVNVANPDERLRPGMTATVTIETARRDDVLRIANSALAFRPSDEALRLAGDRSPQAAGGPASDSGPGKPAAAWLYRSGRLTQVNVRAGFADDQRTEVLRGLQVGQLVVTSATVQPKK